MDHPDFWLEFASRVGPPVLAGTLVAALLRHEFGWAHAALIMLGLALMIASHWAGNHRRRG